MADEKTEHRDARLRFVDAELRRRFARLARRGENAYALRLHAGDEIRIELVDLKLGRAVLLLRVELHDDLVAKLLEREREHREDAETKDVERRNGEPRHDRAELLLHGFLS